MLVSPRTGKPKVMKFRLSTALLSLWLLSSATAAEARMFKVDGTDPRDGSPYEGIGLLSEDGDGRLYFICDSDRDLPQILFTRPEYLTFAGDAFSVTYSPDDGTEHQHYFLAESEGKIGRFYIRHTEMYEARFGARPKMFDTTTGALAQPYVDWNREVHDTFIDDFVGASSVRFRVWNREKQHRDYLFDTSGLSRHLGLIGKCYAPSNPG